MQQSIQRILVLCIGFLFFAGPLAAQHFVRGRVTAEGQPLTGVSVLAKQSGKRTVTNDKGQFRIQARKNDVVVFRYLGFKTRQIALKGRRTLQVKLTRKVESLDDVVVLGYGTVKKSDLTGAVSSVKLDGVHDKRVISVPEALQGRIAGVQILNNTGAPGSGMTFHIRGSTSITGSNQPLIVIDGQPIESDLGATTSITGADGGLDQPPVSPLASLNPSDIESIEVLKDASATAIYGSRGANGVVMITTKSGRPGKDRVTYSARMDISVLPKKLPLLSSLEYMQFENEAALNGNKDSVWSQHQLDSISGEVNTDWQDLLYRTAISQDHQLAFSGGGKKNHYRIAANYSDMESIITNSGLKKGGLRLNYQRNFSKKLNVGLRTYFSYTNSRHAQESNWTGIAGSSAVLGALIFNPLKQVYKAEEDDDLVPNNPLMIATMVDDRTKIFTLVSNFTLSYNFTKHLSYRLRAGANGLYALRQVYYPSGTFIGNKGPNGSASRGDKLNMNYVVDNIFTYKRTFNKVHALNALAGFSYQNWRRMRSSVTSNDFPSDALSYNNFASAAAPGRDYTADNSRALTSWITRIKYTYDRRYLLTFTGRYDGATRLAIGKQWQFFPSIGLGWNISNESFFEPITSTVSLLKIRGSYGVAGNDNIAIGATQAKYGINYVVMGNGIVPGYVLRDFSNPNLRWEKTKQYNLGIDLGFLNNRISLTADLYKKTTTDLLINLSLPGSAGYGNYFTNIGKVVNQGLDIEGTFHVFSGALNWDIGANFSTFKNEVINMGPLDIIYGRNYIAAGAIALGQPLTVARPGYPISSFLGYRTDGIYQTAEEVAKGPEAGTAQPGDIRFADTNGDGVISEADKTVLGDPSPDFTFGFNTSLSYKRFTFNMSILGSQGNQLINLNKWIIGANDAHGNRNALKTIYENRWTGPGTSNRYPRLNQRKIRLHQRFPDWMVEDASFIRLQNVTLGYTFHILQRAGVNSLRLFVSGTNLYTLTDYSGYDPNINAFGHNSLNSGIDFGTLPQPRTFSTGVELTF